MEKDFDIVFNSKKENGKSFQIANGYISHTKIFFEKENTIVTIDAKGQLSFSEMNGEFSVCCAIDSEESGKGVYESVVLKAVDNVITISFPVCEWIDNYPNCDGEHDRWDSRIIGYINVDFDLKKQEAIIRK